MEAIQQDKKRIEIKLPRPHAKQSEILYHPARFNVAYCGRRFGKTELGIDKILMAAVKLPGIYWWVGISWKSASMKRAWRLLKQRTRAFAVIREADKEIRLPNGSEIWLRSADNLSSLAGEGLRGAVLDEFTLMDERVWTEYVRPSLSDFKGWALFIGVPKGRNWAYHLWARGQDALKPEWMSWQCPTVDNPFIEPSEVESARGDLPERVFEQEYLAAILDDGGAVFRYVRRQATIECLRQDGQKYPIFSQAKAIKHHRYVAGIDLGKHEDFTVIFIIDSTTGELVYLDRFNQLEYLFQVERLRIACELFKPKVIKIDRLGNDAVCELLVTCQYKDEETGKLCYFPIEEFVTSNQSKAQIIQQFAIALERKQVRLLNEPTVIAEFEGFSMERLPSGLIRYGAPSGFHDDITFAGCLAWDAAMTYLLTEDLDPRERAMRRRAEMLKEQTEMLKERGVTQEEVIVASEYSEVSDAYWNRTYERDDKRQRGNRLRKRRRPGDYNDEEEEE